MKRHGKNSFTRTSDDKVSQVETPKERKQKEETALTAAAKHQAIGKNWQSMT